MDEERVINAPSPEVRIDLVDLAKRSVAIGVQEYEYLKNNMSYIFSVWCCHSALVTSDEASDDNRTVSDPTANDYRSLSLLVNSQSSGVVIKREVPATESSSELKTAI